MIASRLTSQCWSPEHDTFQADRYCPLIKGDLLSPGRSRHFVNEILSRASDSSLAANHRFRPGSRATRSVSLILRLFRQDIRNGLPVLSDNVHPRDAERGEAFSRGDGRTVKRRSGRSELRPIDKNLCASFLEPL